MGYSIPVERSAAPPEMARCSRGRRAIYPVCTHLLFFGGWQGEEEDMEKLQKDPKVRLLINVLYYGVILALIYVGIKYALPVVMPFVLAFLIVLLLRGPARRLSARTKLPARWLRLLFLVAFYVVLFGLIVLFGAKLISWLGDFIQQMPTFYQNTIRPAIEAISGWVESVVGQFDPSLVASIDNAFEAMSSSLGTAVSSFSSSAVGVVTNFLAGMPGAIVNVVLMVVSSFYLASDYERVTGTIVRYLPEKWRNLLFEVKRKLKQSFGSYLKSYSLIFVMTWGELLVGLLLLRIPFAPLIALLIAICDILPVLGTGTVLIPWAVIAAILGRYPLAIGVGILYLVITVVRNMVEPKLVGKMIGLHPLLTLLGMIVGARLFGILGLFGVPVTLSILVQFRRSRQEEQAGADRPPEGGSGPMEQL